MWARPGGAGERAPRGWDRRQSSRGTVLSAGLLSGRVCVSFDRRVLWTGRPGGGAQRRHTAVRATGARVSRAHHTPRAGNSISDEEEDFVQRSNHLFGNAISDFVNEDQHTTEQSLLNSRSLRYRTSQVRDPSVYREARTWVVRNETHRSLEYRTLRLYGATHAHWLLPPAPPTRKQSESSKPLIYESGERQSTRQTGGASSSPSLSPSFGGRGGFFSASRFCREDATNARNFGSHPVPIPPSRECELASS